MEGDNIKKPMKERISKLFNNSCLGHLAQTLREYFTSKKFADKLALFLFNAFGTLPDSPEVNTQKQIGQQPNKKPLCSNASMTEKDLAKLNKQAAEHFGDPSYPSIDSH